MIPKLIHYCWFGKKLPLHFMRLIYEWKEIMPSYEIKEWNEEKLPNDVPYLKKAYDNRNWANMSNYMRLHAMTSEGGIYMDVDFKVIKPFDKLLKYEAFLGIESISNEKIIINNAVIGAKCGHEIFQNMRHAFLAAFDGTEQANLSSPIFTTEYLEKNGLINKASQSIMDIQLLPVDHFYPYPIAASYNKEPLHIKTVNTYAIHLWDKSWKDEFSYFWIGEFKYGLRIAFWKITKNPIQSSRYYRDLLWHIRQRLIDKKYYKK